METILSRATDPDATRLPAARILAMTVFSAMFAAPAMAVEIGDKVSVHGYGHTSYFRTDGSGSWDDSLVSLLFVAEVADRTRVWVQLHNTTSISHLDWAYVDYRVNPLLTVRGGQIKLPVGLYNEIIDARFLQQSTLPPMLYQEGAGFSYENMRGFNASLTQQLGAGNIVYTGYAGAVATAPDTPATTVYRNLAGVNATWNTPVEGLRLMASGFRNQEQEGDTNLVASGEGARSVGLLSVDYLGDRWDLKGEGGRASFNGLKSRTGYAQVAYAFSESIKPFVRYDTIKFGEGSSNDTKQTTYTLGVTYKLNDNVALRLEGHRSNGYALAYGGWLASSPGGTPDPAEAPSKQRSNALGISINFIF